MYIVTDIITLSDWKKVPAMIYLWLLSAHILHVHRQTLGLHRQMFPLQHFFFHQINRWVVKLQPRINRSRIFFHILLCCFDIRKQWLWDFQLWTYENRISINVRKIHSARLSLRRAGITSLLGPVDHSPLGTCLFFWPVVLQGRKVLIINLIKIYIYIISTIDSFQTGWCHSLSNMSTANLMSCTCDFLYQKMDLSNPKTKVHGEKNLIWAASSGFLSCFPVPPRIRSLCWRVRLLVPWGSFAQQKLKLKWSQVCPRMLMFFGCVWCWTCASKVFWTWLSVFTFLPSHWSW